MSHPWHCTYLTHPAAGFLSAMEGRRRSESTSQLTPAAVLRMGLGGPVDPGCRIWTLTSSKIVGRAVAGV